MIKNPQDFLSAVQTFRYPNLFQSPRWLLILGILLTTPIHAIEESAVVHSLAEIESGSLLIPSNTGDHYIRAPLLDTTVHIGVQGMLARTHVEQTFTNQSNLWLEAIYVFPLPDDASVDTLSMIVADTEIKGVIQPKQKARKIYNQAKRAGKKTSLLEQQRANLFTTRVANIPPGESAIIRIAYQSSVKYTDGQFELMFPLTITPRYIPGTAKTYSDNDLSGHGWSLPTNQVPDADQITPPMTNNLSQTTITVSIDAGLSGLTIASTTHDILTTSDHNTQEVTLANRSIPSDRDFKLRWTPATTSAPVAAVFRQDTELQKDETGLDTHSFASFMLMPPQQIFATSELAREVIFVMDTSGSMGGNSIVQARAALTLAIDRLTDNDMFNIIEFNSATRKLFQASVTANAKNKSSARDWVRTLYADGGTEILGAMKAALNTPVYDERLRQIVFITDGSVGNEDQIFKYLHNNIADARLFTVGIGSAPNTWFMRKAAETGRGSYTNIANANELTGNMQRLLERLEKPALTDVQIKFDTTALPEIYPSILPDVYVGEPVLADARWLMPLTGGSVEISGKYAGNLWSQKLTLEAIEKPTAISAQTDSGFTVNKGLDKLWAHRKIQSLENDLLFNSDFKETEDAITSIAMDYSLVTRFTSLVAVEQKISRPTDGPEHSALNTVAVPQAIPAGSSMMLPQGSLGTTFRFIVSILFALLSVVFGLASLRQVRQFEPVRNPLHGNAILNPGTSASQMGSAQ